jgi:hypothetical protein
VALKVRDEGALSRRLILMDSRFSGRRNGSAAAFVAVSARSRTCDEMMTPQWPRRP